MIFQNFGFNRLIQPSGLTYNYPTDAFAIYDFGNPSSYTGSGTIVYDVSGNGRNATLRNTPTFSSDNGGIMQFQQASSQYFDYSGSMTPDVSTIVIWKNTDATFQNYSGFPSNRSEYGLVWTNDIGSSPFNKQFVPVVFNRDNSSSSTAGSTYIGPSDIQIFHQYAVVIDSMNSTSTNVNTYLDNSVATGSQNLNINRTVGISAPTVSIFVNRDTAAGRYGNGYMMAYLHYNRALTSTEINSIYNNFSNRF